MVPDVLAEATTLRSTLICLTDLWGGEGWEAPGAPEGGDEAPAGNRGLVVNLLNPLALLWLCEQPGDCR